MITIARLTAAATAIGAVATTGAGAWYAGDYMGVRPIIKKEFTEVQEASTEVLQGLVQQQQQIATSVLELQFQSLDQKRAKGELDFQDLQTYCRLAKKLDYVNMEMCQ